MKNLEQLKEANLLAAKCQFLSSKWMRGLKRPEQIYLEKKWTRKEIALFASFCSVFHRTFENDRELEQVLVRYLQLIMILYSVGDEHEETLHFTSYGKVPFHIEKISHGINPYKIELDYAGLYKKITTVHNVDLIYPLAADHTNKWINEFDHQQQGMMKQVMDYYSYALFAYLLLDKSGTSGLRFNQNMQNFFTYLLNKYYPKKGEIKEAEEKRYVECLQIVTGAKIRRKKAA